MYKKVLLAYDGSVEGRRALREGAKLAQLCRAEVFLLAVVELSSIVIPDCWACRSDGRTNGNL
jgi:nucleotide-binding universal stress UspA family protein